MIDARKPAAMPNNTTFADGRKPMVAPALAQGTVSGTRVRIALVSALVLVPCVWQRRIEAGDLRSHLYNTWLAQLIERHQAPGLWLTRVWNNVLFDYLLSGLARVFGLMAGARLATGIAVLVFFWGAFAFVYAAHQRRAWPLVSVLTCLAYGWTFQEGFLNYYLAVGLAFIALAAFLGGGPWRWVVVAALAPLVFLAHPLGFTFLLGALTYIVLLRACSPRFRFLPLALAGVFIVVLRFFLQFRYKVDFPETSLLYNAAFYNGLDQLVLTKRYLLPVLLTGLVLGMAAIRLVLRGNGVREPLRRSSIPLQLYLISLGAILLLPNAILFPGYGAPISALTTRLTAISAVLFCAVLAALPLSRWHLLFLGAAAALFFVFLYQDSAVLNGMENQIERLVRELPAGQRVISTIGGPAMYRFSTKHLVDTPCIGHCFSYGNYEAASRQFRIRASAGNPFVVTNIHDASLMEEGRYFVQAKDLPLYQVYQCSTDWTKLCIRQLKEGERNDLEGVHQGRTPDHP